MADAITLARADAAIQPWAMSSREEAGLYRHER